MMGDSSEGLFDRNVQTVGLLSETKIGPEVYAFLLIKDVSQTNSIRILKLPDLEIAKFVGHIPYSDKGDRAEPPPCMGPKLHLSGKVVSISKTPRLVSPHNLGTSEGW
jgi:hypothetical protein